MAERISDGSWDPDLPDKAEVFAADAATAERKAAIEDASQFLETLPWKGEKARPDQALQWPRVGVVGEDGTPVAGMPLEVRRAVHLVADFIHADVPFTADTLAHVLDLIGPLLRNPPTVEERTGWLSAK